MKVVDLMTPEPRCLGPDDRLYHALELMAAHRMRHVPIVDGEGRLLGMISDRDIKRELNAAFARQDESADDRMNMLRILGEIMTEDVLVCTADTEAHAAARMLVDHRVGALPVIAGQTRAVVGIVCTIDFLEVLIRQRD